MPHADNKPAVAGAVPAALPANEAERLAALRHYQVLDTLPEAVYDDLVFIASQICQTPIALMSLVDGERQWFKARVGLDAEQTHRDLAFCAHAILDPEQVLQVPDASQDERFRNNPLVTGDPSIRFYAGVPLVSPDGLAIGTLCAIDRRPRQLDEHQLRAMTALSRQVMTQLELRRTIATLEKTLSGQQEIDAADKAEVSAAPVSATEERIRALLLRIQQLQKPGVRIGS